MYRISIIGHAGCCSCESSYKHFDLQIHLLPSSITVNDDRLQLTSNSDPPQHTIPNEILYIGIQMIDFLWS